MPSTALPAPSSRPRIVFAGDRDVAVTVMKYLQSRDVQIVGLLTPPADTGSHVHELQELCCHLQEDAVLTGQTFRSTEGMSTLNRLAPDFLLSVHFPYVVPSRVLDIPRVAPLNLHPAYLPYNRGWHTPSWALLEQTPIGATLHVMTERLDAGPIVKRTEIQVRPSDTAHTLYQRIKALEVEVFTAAWPDLETGEATAVTPDTEGTSHAKEDLHQPEVQEIDLDESIRAGRLIDRLRGLTTNRPEEAAYFTQDGQRYRIQVSISPDAE